MAIKLHQAGFRRFRVYEKAAKPGGTWRDNVYPGLACDVPSHLYSFSFELNPGWSHRYSPGAEIQRYVERCIEKYGVRDYFRYNSEVIECRFNRNQWQIQTSDGEKHQADILISAMGGLHLPHLPDIPGREKFSGTAFHSARWQDVDLQDRQVAIIGSAASAVQIAPAIARQVAQLHLFQRTPNWIIPRRDRPYKRAEKWLFAQVPGWARAYRWMLYWIAEARWPAFRKSGMANRLGQLLGVAHLRRSIPDKALRRRLTPDYPIGCKRILRSDDYYPTLQRDNVSLVTAGIDRIESDAIIRSDGQRCPVDVIIYATGFNVFDITGGMRIINDTQQSLNDIWREKITAHRTIAVPGFKNFFILQGPNSGLGHNSVIVMLESQAKYVVQCVQEMQRQKAGTIEARPEFFNAYQRKLEQDLKKLIWQAGCNSWYQDATGHVFTLWPRTCTRYYLSMRKPRFEEFEIRP